ncbi:alpha/beta fold hydrolase [Flavobacterium sp. RHBU_24]|uniref:alpha/beta fold hydrolase n=1 Tax=Flavobacterium sp. RHBU_24 TaxID=3391185 RepID=UPI003985072E
MHKIPVYFMPGLAASPAIFENINLPEDRFACHYLTWLPPEKNEPIAQYAKRLTKGIEENPVLIGVSFGGLIVQEMAKIIKARKVVIISSVRCNAEFPRRMRFAKRIRAYHLFPTRLMQEMGLLAQMFVGNNAVTRRLNLYDKFMSVRDKKYLDWAFKTIINWDRCDPDMDVVHIHGDADEVFPPRYLKSFIPVPGGTHVTVLTKGKWLSEHLPELIEGSVE